MTSIHVPRFQTLKHCPTLSGQSEAISNGFQIQFGSQNQISSTRTHWRAGVQTERETEEQVVTLFTIFSSLTLISHLIVSGSEMISIETRLDSRLICLPDRFLLIHSPSLSLFSNF